MKIMAMFIVRLKRFYNYEAMIVLRIKTFGDGDKCLKI